MEARALVRFTLPDGLLKDLGTESNIRVPRLILYDEVEHVLVIEDLGDHIALNDQIAKLASNSPPTESPYIFDLLGSGWEHFWPTYIRSRLSRRLQRFRHLMA
jgi:hypothetical protein